VLAHAYADSARDSGGSVLATSVIAASVSGNLISSEVEQAATAVVGPGATGPRVIRAQILLACARFSPGEIDGRYGGDLVVAIKGYQENYGLKPTGVVDAGMWNLLDAHTGPLLTSYSITAADVKGPFEKIPKTAADQAKMKWMGYESPEEGLGEKFHMPIGNWKIMNIVHYPWFNWDPVHFWNVDPGKAAEKLPPGPRNPVGMVWMGLSKEHYGIHGTEDPGHVRQGASYGCIRLTNWDVVDLSHLVVKGTPVVAEE
jgi:hypothetical protein